MKPLKCSACKNNNAVVCNKCLKFLSLKFKEEIKSIQDNLTKQQKQFIDYKNQFKLINNKEKDTEYDISYFKNEIEKLRAKVSKYEELIKKNKVELIN